MTTIKNTRLGPTGTKHTEDTGYLNSLLRDAMVDSVSLEDLKKELQMDIQITKHYNPDKRNICGISPMGIAWVMSNLDTKLSDVVSVDAEFLKDLIELMEKDGLTVSER